MRSSEKKLCKAFFFLVMCFIMSFTVCGQLQSRAVFNVMVEGATGDGRTDDGEVCCLHAPTIAHGHHKGLYAIVEDLKDVGWNWDNRWELRSCGLMNV